MLKSMKTRPGFTLVEILITITIMVILLTLAVVNLQSSQVDARDAERRADAESIVRQLDSLYTTGYPSATYLSKGQYPSTLYMNYPSIRDEFFKDLPPSTLISPSADDSTTSSLVIATGTGSTGVISESPSGMTSSPSLSSTDVYVYQPVANNGTLCNHNPTGETCQRFNLYYRSESTNEIIMLRSRHR